MELSRQRRQSTTGQFSYLNRSRNRHSSKAFYFTRKNRSGGVGVKNCETGNYNDVEQFSNEEATKIHKPKARRVTGDHNSNVNTQNEHSDEEQEAQHDKDEEQNANSTTTMFDYTKAMRETTTYNSPVNKEMKRKLGKYRVHEDEVMDYSDENSLATGFLMDIMINSDNANDNTDGDEDDLTQTILRSPPEIEKVNSLDISALDNYLLGKEKCELLDDLELQEQIEMQKEIFQSKKNTNTKRKTSTRRRSTGGNSKRAKPRTKKEPTLKKQGRS